jgi:hypothetical protein
VGMVFVGIQYSVLCDQQTTSKHLASAAEELTSFLGARRLVYLAKTMRSEGTAEHLLVAHGRKVHIVKADQEMSKLVQPVIVKKRL